VLYFLSDAPVQGFVFIYLFFAVLGFELRALFASHVFEPCLQTFGSGYFGDRVLIFAQAVLITVFLF
jgi:hypothetical protein